MHLTAAADRFWHTDATRLPPGARQLLLCARVVAMLIGDLADGQLSLRAMSLVYTTLLSLVPLLAVTFSVSQAFGVHNRLQGELIGLLIGPLGEQAISITDQIVGFVENVNVKVLGAFGLGVLIYTVVSLTQKVESAVNHTWRIERTRGFFERFSRYLSVILVGPVLVVAAMAVYTQVMTSDVVTDVMSIGPVGELRAMLAQSVPYLLVIAAFTFVYIYIPNTRVNVAAAVTGGIVAGLLWTLAGGAFARFVVSSTAYAAIYSSFAILVLFLIWLYVGWLVLLIGAAVSFYVQHPEQVGVRRAPTSLGGKLVERLGLDLACRVARAYAEGVPPPPLAEQANRLNVPADSLARVAGILEDAGWFVRPEGTDDCFIPGRDPSTTRVADLLDTLRESGAEATSPMARMRHFAAVEEVALRVDGAVMDALGTMTLRDLALGDLSLDQGPIGAHDDEPSDEEPAGAADHGGESHHAPSLQPVESVPTAPPPAVAPPPSSGVRSKGNDAT